MRKKVCWKISEENIKKIESKWNLWYESCIGVEKFIFFIKKRGRGMDVGRGKLWGLLFIVVVFKVNLGDRIVF